MAIPHDNDIQFELLILLSREADGTLPCCVVYSQLAKLFPGLSMEETQRHFGKHVSKWANRVQFARLHSVEKGHIYSKQDGKGHGLWTITDIGRSSIKTAI